MKKIGIISPIARIIIDESNIRSLEVIYLKKYLEETYKCTVDFISKKINEKDQNYINIFDLESLNHYDALYIHNHNSNFFGGTVPSLTVKYLRLLADYHGKVTYYITDPKLKYVNLATIINNRKKNLKFEDQSIDLYHNGELKKIESDLKFMELRMNALFTGYNYQPIYGLDFSNVKKFDVFKTIKFDYLNKAQANLFDEDDLILYDCCYYGDNRGTHRNNKIKKYFNTDKLNTLLIGCNLDIVNNTYVDKVPHQQLHRLVKRSYSSLVIGDKEHENAFVTMRFYENIHFDVVSFIDKDYDANKVLFKSQLLKDFNYINSQDELKDKVRRLQTEKNLLTEILKLQKQELN